MHVYWIGDCGTSWDNMLRKQEDYLPPEHPMPELIVNFPMNSELSQPVFTHHCSQNTLSFQVQKPSCILLQEKCSFVKMSTVIRKSKKTVHDKYSHEYNRNEKVCALKHSCCPLYTSDTGKLSREECRGMLWPSSYWTTGCRVLLALTTPITTETDHPPWLRWNP